jgi:hypothetical protein
MDRSSSVRLTKTVAEKSEVRDARFDLWDSELAGFGLRVEKSGTKTFIIRYRTDGGGRSAPRRFMTVARFGTLTVEQARKKAKTLLGAAASGGDPAGEPREASRENDEGAARLLRTARLLHSARHPQGQADEAAHEEIHHGAAS